MEEGDGKKRMSEKGIKYHASLRIGSGISEKKLDKLKKNLEKHPLRTDVYLICVSRSQIDQLEIYSSRQLAQSYYRKYPPYVAGIAGTYDEALELLEEMVQDCFKQRGDCSLKEYLLC